MTLQRENAVVENRKLMGATNPVDAEEGTLRKNTVYQLIKTLFMVQIALKMLRLN